MIVNDSLLTDMLGREIDCADDGQAGSDFIATISGKRVTAGGPPLSGTSQQPVALSNAIDAPLARGELTALTRSGRTRR